MKAVVLHETGGIEKLIVEDVPIPSIRPTETLIRVRACGVNRVDLMVREGQVGLPVPLPHVMGTEVAGDVVEVGTPTRGVEPGRRVVVACWLRCGMCEFCLENDGDALCLRSGPLGMVTPGGYAEYVAVPTRQVIPIPDNVSHEAAAAVNSSMVSSWHMLRARAKLQPGEDLLVHAAGSGVGSAAVQIGRLVGARVIATASSQDKLDKARELGADEVINYAEQDFLEEVRRITNKRGVDVVFEHVGTATWEKSLASLARNGRLVTCGTTTGREGKIDLWTFFAKQLTILGSNGGTRREVQQVMKLIGSGQLHAVIDRTLPLEQAGEAHRLMEDRAVFGKFVLVP